MFGFPRSPGKQDFRARPRLYNNTMPLKDCLLLLDAGRETYAHNETNIATLHDFSGNENHATVTGSALTYTNDTVPAFHFDGSQYAGTPAIGVGEGTLFLVSKTPSSSYLSGYCVSMASAQSGALGGYTGRGLYVHVRDDQSAAGFFYTGTAYYQYFYKSSANIVNRFILRVLRWKDAYTETWYRHCGLNALTSFGRTDTIPLTVSANPFWISAIHDDANHIAQQFTLLGVYGRALEETEIIDIENALIRRFTITRAL